MHISFHGKNVCGAVAWPPQRVHVHLNKQASKEFSLYGHIILSLDLLHIVKENGFFLNGIALQIQLNSCYVVSSCHTCMVSCVCV